MCLRFCDFWIALLTFTWEQFSAGRSLTGMSYLATWPIWHNHWLCQLCMMTLSTFASHLMCSPVSSILCIDNFVIVKGSYLFCGALFEPRPHPKKGLVSSVWMNVLGHDESKIRTFNDDIYIYYTCMYIMYIYIYIHMWVYLLTERCTHYRRTHTHRRRYIHDRLYILWHHWPASTASLHTWAALFPKLHCPIFPCRFLLATFWRKRHQIFTTTSPPHFFA